MSYVSSQQLSLQSAAMNDTDDRGAHTVVIRDVRGLPTARERKISSKTLQGLASCRVGDILSVCFLAKSLSVMKPKSDELMRKLGCCRCVSQSIPTSSTRKSQAPEGQDGRPQVMLGGSLISHEGVLPSHLPSLLGHTHTPIRTMLKCLCKRLYTRLLGTKTSGTCHRHDLPPCMWQ